jgi:hypothetical protein
MGNSANLGNVWGIGVGFIYRINSNFYSAYAVEGWGPYAFPPFRRAGGFMKIFVVM